MQTPVKFYSNEIAVTLLREWSDRTGLEFYDYRTSTYGENKNYFVVVYISGLGYPVTDWVSHAIVMAETIANLNGYVKVTVEDKVWWNQE